MLLALHNSNTVVVEVNKRKTKSFIRQQVNCVVWVYNPVNKRHLATVYTKSAGISLKPVRVKRQLPNG